MIDRNRTTLRPSEPYKNHWSFRKEQNRCTKLQKRWFKYVDIWKSNFGTCIFLVKNTVWPLDWRQPCSKKRRSLKLIKLLVATFYPRLQVRSDASLKYDLDFKQLNFASHRKVPWKIWLIFLKVTYTFENHEIRIYFRIILWSQISQAASGADTVRFDRPKWSKTP